MIPRSIQQQAKDAEEIMMKPASLSEVFFSSLHPSNGKTFYSLNSSLTLRTSAIPEWPSTTDALCLHCSEHCPGTPFPAVKYYDAGNDKYWVYGFFCRPGCSLAHIDDQRLTDYARCKTWTQHILRTMFQFKGSLHAFPPRCTLAKYGGALTLSEFYGDSADFSTHITLHSPPFVTFAMFSEVCKGKQQSTEKSSSMLLRPDKPLGQQTIEQTGKPPMLLNFLADLKLSSSKKPKVDEEVAVPMEDEEPKKSSLKKWFVKK